MGGNTLGVFGVNGLAVCDELLDCHDEFPMFSTAK
jgi:hypothetical protein